MKAVCVAIEIPPLQLLPLRKTAGDPPAVPLSLRAKRSNPVRAQARQRKAFHCRNLRLDCFVAIGERSDAVPWNGYASQ
jgi:hypothetical protein